MIGMVWANDDRQCVYWQERQPGDIQRYNDIIRHETLRVAVCNVLEGKYKYPAKFRCGEEGGWQNSLNLIDDTASVL